MSTRKIKTQLSPKGKDLLNSILAKMDGITGVDPEEAIEILKRVKAKCDSSISLAEYFATPVNVRAGKTKSPPP